MRIDLKELGPKRHKRRQQGHLKEDSIAPALPGTDVEIAEREKQEQVDQDIQGRARRKRDILKRNPPHDLPMGMGLYITARMGCGEENHQRLEEQKCPKGWSSRDPGRFFGGLERLHSSGKRRLLSQK